MSLKINKLMRRIFWPAIFMRRVRSRYQNRMSRHYHNLFSNIIEGRIVVTVNGIRGLFEIDIRSHILQRVLIDKYYEPNIVTLIEEQTDKDRDAVNVGANIGIFTILLTDLLNNGGRVLAIEPTPLAFELLQNNINRNKINNRVSLFNGICTDRPGDYLINTIPGKEEYSCIGESQHISNIRERNVQFKVKGERLDNLVTNLKLNPGIIMMDVEGSEMKVLSGAEKTLDRYKPIIISELDDGLLKSQQTSSKDVIGFLIARGYRVENANKHHRVRYPYCGNIVAIPKD